MQARVYGAQAAGAAPFLRLNSPDADLAIVDSSLGISEGGHSSKSDQCLNTFDDLNSSLPEQRIDRHFGT